MISLSSLFAEEKTLVLGGEKGWSRLEKTDGLTFGKGRFGWDSLELATNARVAGSDTDLLLDFENSSLRDVKGNYDVLENKTVPSAKAKIGQGSALCRGVGGIRLSGSKNSIFGKEGPAGSFLIEFWLCPSIAENGEVVFSWRSSRTEGRRLLYQTISASFFANRLRWEFTNVFNGYDKDSGSLSIACGRTIIPNVWTHHQISFDEDTGLLEYRIDGRLEALKYVTTNGREHGGSVYSPFLGVAADVDICPKYTGLIDDFRIKTSCTSQSSQDLRYDSYKKDGGRFVTEPILLSREAEFTGLDAIVNLPEQTDVVFYVRSGDDHFNWTETEPAWVLVKNHSQISDVKGLYFQVAADLFPDGGGSHTPSISEIKIKYKEVPSPLPPFSLIADAGDGQVTLTWAYSVDSGTGGYYVFYGERPGEYLGYEAVEGNSPLDVGNVAKITLTGLKNGKIYYFAIASYSEKDKRIMGTLSKEVYARPLKK